MSCWDGITPAIQTPRGPVIPTPVPGPKIVDLGHPVLAQEHATESTALLGVEGGMHRVKRQFFMPPFQRNRLS